MKVETYNRNFMLFYLIFLGAAGAFMPHINVYLEKNIGLTGSQMGLITALSLIIGVCVIPIWGVLGDKTKKYSALLKVSLAGSLVMVTLYYQAATYPMILLCAIGLEIIRLGTTPMADTITTNFCHQTGKNYGSIRSMGSLGYMLSSMAVGFLADRFGLDGPLFATYAVLLAIAFMITFGFPKTEGANTTREKAPITKATFKELVTNRRFIFILSITLLTTVVVDSAMNYAGNHLTSTLGGSSSTISWMIFATVLPEVAFLTVALKIMKKIGFKKFYSIAIISMIIRFAVYSVIGNIYFFLGISIVHCLGVATVTVGNLTYIRNSVNPIVLGTAITLLNASMTIGRATLGYLFGLLYEYSNSYIIFTISTGIFIFALCVLLRTKQFAHIDANLQDIT